MIVRLANRAVFNIFVFLGLSISSALAQLAAPVEVDLVIHEPLSQTAPVIGRFVPIQQGEVASQISSSVSDMLVKIGDRVRAGEIIVLLDSRRFEQSRQLQVARVEGMKNALKTAELELSLSKQELDRLDKLKGSAAFSKAKFDDKLQNVAREFSKVSEVETRLVEARASLRLAQIDLEATEIRAPYNGVIVEIHTERGAFVSVGGNVVTMVNDEDMEIEADVPSRRIKALSPGLVVSFSLPNGGVFDALVRARIPVENSLTRTRAVRFTPALSDAYHGKIAAGETATVFIPVGDVREVISVHKDAVMPSANGYFVYVVEEGKAVSRPVQLGESLAGRFEVLGGLMDGDIVIIKGNERLYPNQPVNYEGIPQGEGEPTADQSHSG